MRNILLQTYGVCFLGTPHRGSTAAIGELAYQTNSSAKKGSKRKLLQFAEKGTENINLINDEFRHVLAGTSMQICSFYEEKKTRSVGSIVSKDSAIIGLPMEVVSSFPTDHANMTKFSSENDAGFTRLRSQLQRWIADIQVQKQLPEEVKDDSRSKVSI